MLQQAAATLRQWLDGKYKRYVDSSNPDVITRRRRFDTTDYVFAVNDQREFGTYVGPYGLVMEDGLPSETTVTIQGDGKHVYDLTQSREVAFESSDGSLLVPLQLGPCSGRILMVTERPIRKLVVEAPENAVCSESIGISVAVSDGAQPVNAVVPVHVEIHDPEGRESEFSGYYAAVDGQLSIEFDFAVNHRVGMWEIRARELASGLTASAYVRLKQSSD